MKFRECLLLFRSEYSFFLSPIKKHSRLNIQSHNFTFCFVWVWSLTIMEEHMLRVFDDKVLRRIFGPKRQEETGGWENCTVKSFIIYTFHQILV